VSDSSACSSSKSNPLSEQPTVSFVACLFERNNASGLGGGAIHVGGGASRLQALSTAGNAALTGGGGVLLWEGETPPEVTGGRGGVAPLYGTGAGSNRAAYGPLYATLFTSLAVLPAEPLAWPGVEVEVVVEKRDHYGQRIVTDDASLVTLKPESITPQSWTTNHILQTLNPTP